MDGNTPTLQPAIAALKLWPVARQNLLVPFGTSASSVFGVRVNGTTHFLRLTSQSIRIVDDIADELSFLDHLCAHGVRVPMPVPPVHGENVERVCDYLATLFRRAPSARLTPESRLWNRAFFREWGRTLAFQHQAARAFCNSLSGWRQDWRRGPVLFAGLKHIERTTNNWRVPSMPFLLTCTCEVIPSAKLVRSMPTSHRKIFDTLPNLALQRSTSTTAASIGFCMTSRSRCRSYVSDRNVSNWFNGFSKATVNIANFRATRSALAFCCAYDCSTSIAIDFTVPGLPLDQINQIFFAFFATA
jgi:hypothetical protein